MTFLHLQLALAGLACVGIPILIHLLMRRRRKPVMWGAMRFLLEAYRKHKRRLMIEKWLLLATRCLLVALLGLAIGRPLVGAILGGATGRTVYVLLDNGLAAGVVGPDGTLALDRHKDAAREVLETLQGAGADGDRAALIALGSPAEGVVLPVSADVAAVATLLDGVEVTESRTDLPGAISLVAASIEADRAAAGAAARPGQTFVLVLSDLLEGSADLTASLAKLPEGVKVLASAPASSGAPNVAITGVEPLRSVVVTGKAEGAGEVAAGEGASASAGDQVRVMLRRWGPGVAQAGSSTVVLSMAGVRDRADEATLAEAARATVRWAPGQETATAALQAARRPAGVERTAGTGTLTEVLEARLADTTTGVNALAGDDTWRRPVEVRDALRVGIVSPRRFGPRERVDRLDASEWLRLALRPGDDAAIEVTELEPALLDGARLAGLDAVCLPRPDLLAAEHWPRLRLFLESGGMLLVMPPSELQVHLWSDAMTKELGLAWRIAREPKIYGGQGGMPATIAPVTPGGEGKSDLLSLIESEVNDLAKPVSVWKVLPVETERNEGRRLLSLGDGTPLVLAQSYAGPGGTVAPPADAAAAPAASASRGSDRGLIVYIAVAPDLEWTDLPAKPLMVPLVQEIVREGIGRAHGSWWSIAGERPATPSRSAELRAITLQGGGAGTVGDERAGLVAVNELGLTSVPLRRAGLWRAADERGAARGVVAVNPDTRGSRTQAQETASLEQWLGRAAFDGKVVWVGDAERTAAAGTPEGNTVGSLAELLARESSGSPISLPLLIAALCVAVFELWLARFASHAGVPVVTPRRKGVAA